MSDIQILKSFKISVVSLGLFLMALISIIIFNNTKNNSALLVGLPLLIAGILAMIGTTQIIKGRKAKKDFKFIFAALVNISLTLLLLILIITNLVDLIKII